jgi:hypothetical protein
MKGCLSNIRILAILIASLAAIIILPGLVRDAGNHTADMLDGVSEEKQYKAKNIVLSRYPNFESEVQQRIQSNNRITAAYIYRFRPTKSDHIIVLQYVAQDVSLLNVLIGNSSTEISIAVTVDLIAKTVTPVDCVPNNSWWSSQKTTCQ